MKIENDGLDKQIVLQLILPKICGLEPEDVSMYSLVIKRALDGRGPIDDSLCWNILQNAFAQAELSTRTTNGCLK